MGNVKIYIEIYFALLFTTISYASPITVNAGFTGQNISDKVFVWLNTDKDVTPDSALLHLRQQHKPYGKDYFDVNHRAFYWIYAPIVNHSKNPMKLLLEVDNPHIDTLYYWAYKGNMLTDTSVAGDCLEFSKRKVEHRNFLYPFELQPNDTIALLLKICKYGQPMALQFSLYNQQNFAAVDARLSAIHMLVFGAILFAVFCILAFTLYMRRFGLLFLAMAMFILLLEAAWQLGYGFQYLCRNLIWYNNLMRATFLNAFVFFNVLFIYKALRLHGYNRWWAWGIKLAVAFAGCFLLSMVILGIFGINYYSSALKVYFVSILVFIFFLFLSLLLFLYRYSKGNNNSLAVYLFYFYMVALPFLLFNIIILVLPLHLLPYLFIKHISFISCIIFVLLSIAYVLRVSFEQQNETVLLRNMANHALIKGQEQERERIARNLHDSIGNSLIALRNLLQIAQFVYASEQKRLVNMVTYIAKETRNISHNLAPVDLNFDEPFSRLIGDLCRMMQDTMPGTKLTFYPDLPDDMLRNQPEAQTILYRIVQELLTNIAKHANAQNAEIRLFIKSGNLHLLVTDNGSGYNVNEKTEGLGLRNIGSYVAYLGGRMHLFSTNAETGTEITISLRFNRPAHSPKPI
ncbi:hypothetical protein C7N43_03405 [Sphingobacteriales bacterium UPWRP_1]|nr:hypothetical protein BVG80_08810 [Sphingobacteriales bacterium TSM_CSM]PSJ78525.1 hypothetical protein C7N43_03405 [Sphingobacteriales bacterium UPWRP_1]